MYLEVLPTFGFIVSSVDFLERKDDIILMRHWVGDISKMAEKEVPSFIFPMETSILTTIRGWEYLCRKSGVQWRNPIISFKQKSPWIDALERVRKNSFTLPMSSLLRGSIAQCQERTSQPVVLPWGKWEWKERLASQPIASQPIKTLPKRPTFASPYSAHRYVSTAE